MVLGKAIRFVLEEPEDFDDLMDIMSKGDENKVSLEWNPTFNTLWFKSDDGETELYLKCSYLGYLVISRIAFVHKRKGIGTKVLEYLKGYAKEQGLLGIEVESTITPEINNFCVKNDFKMVKGMGEMIEGQWYGNYRLDF